MIEIKDIQDAESLKAWLDALPVDEDVRGEIARGLACRAAMRVLPVLWRYYAVSEHLPSGPEAVLPILRLCFVGTLCLGDGRREELMRYLEQAASAGELSSSRIKGHELAARNAFSIIAAYVGTIIYGPNKLEGCFRTISDGPTNSVAVSNNVYPVWSVVQKDCKSLLDGIPGSDLPLWYDEEVPFFQNVISELHSVLQDYHDVEEWEFWLNFYSESFTGQLRDPGLYVDVARIPSTVWAKGLASVRDSIASIELSRANAVTELSQTKAASELWEDKAKGHEDRAEKAKDVFTCGIALTFVCIVLCLALFSSRDFGIYLIVFSEAGEGKADRLSALGYFYLVASLTGLTLALWALRLKIKEHFSEQHLAQDARERAAFIKTYVDMLQHSGTTESAQNSRELVYASIFRPASDGLVKDESGLDPSVSALIAKMLDR